MTRLARFGTGGVAALAVQVALFWTFFAGMYFAPFVAGGLAAIIAMFLSFVFSAYITWGDRRPATARSPLWRAGRFYVVIGSGYVIYLVVFRALLILGVLPFWGNLLGAVASGGWNFLLHSVWTFRTS